MAHLDDIEVVSCQLVDAGCVTHIEIIKSKLPAPRRVSGANRVVPLITSVWQRNSGRPRPILTSSEPSLATVYSKIISDPDCRDDRECQLCFQECLTPVEVEHHVNNVHPEVNVSPESCFVCRKKYVFNTQLEDHLSQLHGIQYPEMICKICFMEFRTTIEKRAHERKHSKEFNCHLCSLKFASEYFYQKHFDGHMVQLKPFECQICGKRFHNNTSLRIHEKRHFIVSCLSCGKLFENDLSLILHIKTHGPEKEKLFLKKTKSLDLEEEKLEDLLDLYLKSTTSISVESWNLLGDVCPSNDGIDEVVGECMEALLSSVSSAATRFPHTYNNTIFNQMSTPCSASSLECRLCSQRVASAKEMMIHRQKSHLRNRTCLFCGRRSGSVSQTHRHMITHVNNLKTKVVSEMAGDGLSCSICGKVFKNNRKKNIHLETVHKMNIITRPFSCSTCPCKFVNKTLRDKHELKHKEENTTRISHPCPICQQSFVRPTFLAKHLTKHEVTHSCEECSKTFDSQTKLQIHLRSHTSDAREKFKCSYCAVCCSTFSGLRVHLRTHTGERPFGCEQCDKKFKRSQALKKHLLQVHRDDDSVSHACQSCTMTFSDRSNLLRHFLRVHRGLRRFICGVCGNRYGQNQDLKRHLKMKHDLELPNIKGSDRKSVNEVYVMPPLEDNPSSPLAAEAIRRIIEEEKAKFEGVIDLNVTDVPIVDPDDPTMQFENSLSEEPSSDSGQVNAATESVEISQLSSLSRNTEMESMNREDHVKESDAELISEFQPQYLPLLGLLTQLGEHSQVGSESLTLQQCELCSMIFYLDSHFKEHLLQRKENTCQHCGASFCQPSTLQDHEASVHVMTTICYRCGICFVDFTEKQFLTQHMESLHGVTLQFELSPSDIIASKLQEPTVVKQINSTIRETLGLAQAGETNGGEQAENTIPVTVDEIASIGDEPKLCNAPVAYESAVLPVTLSYQNVLNLTASSVPSLFTLQNSSLISILPSQQHSLRLETTSLQPPKQLLNESLPQFPSLSVPATALAPCPATATATVAQSTETSKKLEDDEAKPDGGPEKFTCAQCGKQFPEVGRLVRHINSHLGLKPFECTECGKFFSEKHNLKVHARSHSGDRPYACAACGKRMRYQREYTDHLRMHQGVKPHECAVCQRRFLRLRELNRHRLTHSGEKKHKCQICDKGFYRLDELNAHIASHASPTDGPTFTCEACQKIFNSKIKLQRHKILHSVENKQHKCPLCDKSFAVRVYLKQHLKTHEKRNSYVACPKCPRKFSSDVNLNIHLKKFHERLRQSPRCAKHAEGVARNGEEMHEVDAAMDIIDLEMQHELLSAVNMLEADKSNPAVNYFQIVQEDLEPPLHASAE